MIAASQAKRLTPDRFTAMVRLDENRGRAQLAKKAGVSEVVFDRGGNRYAGRVAAIAEAAREGGLKL